MNNIRMKILSSNVGEIINFSTSAGLPFLKFEYGCGYEVKENKTLCVGPDDNNGCVITILSYQDFTTLTLFGSGGLGGSIISLESNSF